jgi:hypothetical protein
LGLGRGKKDPSAKYGKDEEQGKEIKRWAMEHEEKNYF